jgi:pyrimidine-nucleoside phosphorylase
LVEKLPSAEAGFISGIDAYEVGISSVLLGGGRAQKGDPIDYSVGIVLHKKVGDWVEKGEALLTVHANQKERLEEAQGRLLSAFRWSELPYSPPPHILKIILPGS